MDEISQRILRKIGIPDFFERICPLNTADFNSVLLKLFSLRTARSSPRKVLHTFRENRFAAPGDVDPGSENNHYYRGLNFKIYMQKEGERIEIADGGFVDWISKMTGDKKDRCLISGLGLERLLSLTERDN